MNSLKTAVLLGALTGLLILIGGYVGGKNGMLIAFIFAMGMNFFSYWFSDKIVLRMYQAQEVTPQQAPELHRMVNDLAMKAGLPMPRVYIIPGDTPNAFATGRNEKHAVVAVTEGIMRILSRKSSRASSAMNSPTSRTTTSSSVRLQQRLQAPFPCWPTWPNGRPFSAAAAATTRRAAAGWSE